LTAFSARNLCRWFASTA